MSKWLRQDRVPEWITAMIMLGLSFALGLPGDTITKTSELYGWFTYFHLDDAFLATVFAVTGCFRIGALLVNGLWKRTPAIRMYGSIAGSFLFLFIAAISLMPMFGPDPQPANTAFVTYFVLALSDIRASYQAGRDVGITNK